MTKPITREWLAEQIDATIAILRVTLPGGIESALPKIALATGRAITTDVLTSTFRRRGIGRPSEYCVGGVRNASTQIVSAGVNVAQQSVDVDLSDLDYDDLTDTEPQKRTTVPSAAMPQVGEADRFWVDRHPERSPRERHARRLAFIPDIHTQIRDKVAFDRLLLRVLADWKPDIIVQGGDILDCEALSSYARKPSGLTLKDEVGECNSDVLDPLDAIGADEKYLTIGNHEGRIDREITDKIPGLTGLVDVAELLHLKERGWKWCDWRDYLQVGKVTYTHEVANKCGAQAHSQSGAILGSCSVIGHTHRMAMSFSGTVLEGSRVNAMFGHLIDLTKIHYMYRAQLPMWQLGFGTGIVLDDGVTFLRPHPIISYTCEVDSRVYSA